MNLVNGMIVDGLGHVSLDSGAPGSALANNTLSQANIHQGKIKDTFKYVMIHYLKNKVGVVDFANAQGLVMF